MLKQNLNDQCFSMANIFSFAEKVIPDFKNQSEGEKFLFLYCITAKLLSNRLYDNESAEVKINCLLSRIPKDKAKDAEQLKNLLETFVVNDDYYYSVHKVKSFFEANKDLLNKIYGNEKPADLLFFFIQMQSKKMFTNDDHRRFFKLINESIVQNGLIEANDDSYWLAGKVVNKQKIEDSLKSNPDRKFNEYIGNINQKCGLNINILEGDKYKTRRFKLEKRNYNEKWMVSDGKPLIENKKNYKSENEYISQTLDIDKILKEKFGFKKINEMSKDELEKLGLSYDEEFIYFLVSEDFSNENIFQDTLLFYNFIMLENIKPETTLKIYDYFALLNHENLPEKSVCYLRDKFKTSKDLLDAYDKLKNCLSFKKNKLLELFIGNPPKVKQVLKCQDTKSHEDINKLLGRCEFQNVIDYFVETDDNKKQDLLSKYMLQNPERLCNDLKYINNKLNDLKKNKDKNDNKLKKLQDLMTSFFALENADKSLNTCDFTDVINYFLEHDEGKELLLKNIYNNVKKLENYFGNMLKLWTQLKNDKNKTEQNTTKLNRLEYLITKFLFDCKEEVFENNQKYIDCIVDMFSSQQKFCMYDLNDKKEIDVNR